MTMETWSRSRTGRYGRRLGLVSDAEHDGVGRAREEVLSMLGERTRLFAQEWTTWRPDPVWRWPVLPDDVLSRTGLSGG
ncbi:hypothetical protein [Actinopolymorpha sp. B17G11]|uniref:hypothetical protein n=1 Tax=Actinopolymorpha sp. B17G11 TaxID=3160861 RepID=UPI0032E4AA4B